MPPLIARMIFLPTLGWNVLWGRLLQQRRWWDSVDAKVLLGARPFRHDVAKLRDLGIRGIVNMCMEYEGPIDLYDSYRMEQLWLPTIDFQPPTLEHIVQGVEFIQGMVAQGSGVYVHCKAGRARSATVVLCWMVKYRGMSPEQAQARLLECRSHTNPVLFKRDVVSEFVTQLKDSQSSFEARTQDES